jgi:phosphoglycerate dehydrogenase-like enzyme
VLLADPTVSDQEALLLGVQLVGLDDLMAGSSVVSLHAPVLPSTIGMIPARQLAAMKDGSTFINTARGALVDHDALRREAATGRISLVLDVTSPELLPSGDPLYSMPNVILTPHIAGSMGNELTLLGDLAVSEIERFAAGQPNKDVVTRHALDLMA